MYTCVIIPAYNEEQTIGSVIDQVRSCGHEPIVINDGSRDGTESIAKSKKCVTLTHPLNRGLGAALRTGFAYAEKNNFHYAVTLDADGQHNPQDIDRLIEKLTAGNDVVVGSRMINTAGMPWHRILANKVGNWVTIGGHISTDSQSGLRGIKVSALKKMKLTSSTPPGMEISSEIIEETYRNKLRYTEIEIKPIYTDYSLSKGQSLRVGINTWLRLMFSRLFK